MPGPAAPRGTGGITRRTVLLPIYVGRKKCRWAWSAFASARPRTTIFTGAKCIALAANTGRIRIIVRLASREAYDPPCGSNGGHIGATKGASRVEKRARLICTLISTRARTAKAAVCVTDVTTCATGKRVAWAGRYTLALRLIVGTCYTLRGCGSTATLRIVALVVARLADTALGAAGIRSVWVMVDATCGHANT